MGISAILYQTKVNPMNTQRFYQSFLQLKTQAEVQDYLRDLLTPKEIAEFSERLKVADMLNQKTTYAKIAERTSMSSTTIARVSKWLKNGTGYKRVLARLHHNQTPSTPL